MSQILNLIVTPEQAETPKYLRNQIVKTFGSTNFSDYVVLKKSIDARNRNVKINVTVL